MSDTTTKFEAMTCPAPGATHAAPTSRLRPSSLALSTIVDGRRAGRGPIATGQDRTGILGMTGANANKRLLRLIGSRSG